MIRWRFNQYQFTAMGSPCDIRLYAQNTAQAAQAIAQAVADIDRLETRYSRFIPGNFWAQVNQAAQRGGRCAIDADCAALLDYADQCYQQSDGLFDITAGVLREIWDFQRGSVPSDAQIAAVLARVGWPQVSWTRQEIAFARPGMALDLGGIVKEYAVDVAAGRLAQAGIVHGVVSLGGDMRALGPQPDGTPWPIKIRHPRQPDASLTQIDLAQGALATSGDYERYVEIAGQRYSHILSPKTGWPVQGLVSVTVLAPQCIVAGSACTIAMLRGEQGKAWLDELGLPCVWMDAAGDWQQRPGLNAAS